VADSSDDYHSDTCPYLETLLKSKMKKRIIIALLSITVLTAIYPVINYLDFPHDRLPGNPVIDSIVVRKSKKTMLVYQDGKLLKTYRCALGMKSKEGPKRFKGDHRTPEGVYTIFNKNHRSVAYKNLGISYPNAVDRERAKKLGKPAGRDIKIHGFINGKNYGKFHWWRNWTAGCIAVTNSEMDELYYHTKIGATIIILP
jgi:murein L,D-transpeptidase YafK